MGEHLMPLTSKQKTDRFRKRNLSLGRAELRGIMATKKEQVILKKIIRLELERLRDEAL